jgi:hypothetical protein
MQQYLFSFLLFLFGCFFFMSVEAGVSIPASNNTIATTSIHSNVTKQLDKQTNSLEVKATQSMNKWLKIGLISLGATVLFLLLFALVPSAFFSLLFITSLLCTLIFGIGGLVKLASDDSGGSVTQASKSTNSIVQNAAPIASNIKEGDSIKVAEPEFSGNFVYVNQPTGKGIALEKQKCFTKANASASVYITGMGSVSSKSVVNNAASPIRIPANSKLYFIVRVKDNTVDPSTQINFFPLSKVGNKRQVVTGKSSTFGGAKAGDIDFIAFNATKYGKNSYLVELPAGLQKGEYAITLDGSRDLFNLFGVD